MNWDTTWKALGQPRPRSNPATYVEHAWTARSALSLDPPRGANALIEQLTARRSARHFAAVDAQDLSTLLWAVAGCKESVDSLMGFPLERRGSPSAGAIHPIHILVCEPETKTLHRYDGQSHALEPLETTAPLAMLESFEMIVPRGEGTLLLFAAEPGKTASKYADPVSLVLRDAGVLQGTLAVAAAALSLNFCLLGATGDPWIAGLSHEGKLRGVGAAIVGARPRGHELRGPHFSG